MKRSCTCASETADAKRGAAVLSLNVGGCRLQISRATAGRIPYFEPYLEGRLPFACDEEGWIFVDRCGDLFKYILQFARDNRRPSRNVLFEHKDALLAELLERSLWTRCLPEGSWCSFLDDDFCHVHRPDNLNLRELVMLAFLAALQRRVHLWGLLHSTSCPAPSAW